MNSGLAKPIPKYLVYSRAFGFWFNHLLQRGLDRRAV
jgi:hypothetical protein